MKIDTWNLLQKCTLRKFYLLLVALNTSEGQERKFPFKGYLFKLRAKLCCQFSQNRRGL